MGHGQRFPAGPGFAAAYRGPARPGDNYHLLGAISVSGHSGNDSIHVAFQSIEDDTSRIYYLRSTNQVNPSQIRSNNMPTWSSASEISTSGSYPATNPSIDYADDTVLVAWRGPGENSDVYMGRRPLGGVFASSANRTETSSYESDYPSVWGRFGLAWHEETDSYYDIDLSLGGHLCHLSESDSVSKYPHTAVTDPDEIYQIFSYTCWTEQTDECEYHCWFKTYDYVPDGEGQGGGATRWLRLAPGQSLLEVCPNPATRDARVNCFVPRESMCRLQVHDLTGRVVRTLHSGRLEAGRHAVVWDGRDEAGLQVPRGSYYVRLAAGRSVASAVLTLVE